MAESKFNDAADQTNRRKTREESFKEINDTQEFYIDMLPTDRRIVYDAVSGRDVSIDLSGHKYGYDLPDWSLYDNEEVSEGL